MNQPKLIQAIIVDDEQAARNALETKLEMPHITGLELTSHLPTNHDFHIVFVTAYDQYAIQAFKVKAIDYLLKPVDKDDLIQCIDAIRVKASNNNRQEIYSLVSEMFKSKKEQRLIIKTIDGFELINQNDIIYLKADSNYCHIILKDDKKTIASKTLNHIDNLLDDSLFLRVHRSFTVNTAYIMKLITSDGYHLQMINEDLIPVSRRKKTELLEYLGQV